MTTTRIRYRESDILEKLIIFSLLLSPILQTYGWGKFDISFILTSVLSVIFIVKNKFRSTLSKVLLYYFLYRILIHEISASDLVSLIPLGIIKILLAYIMFFGIKNSEFFIKSYKIIALICIAFFFLQETTFALFGHRISGVIEQFPLALDVDAGAYFEKLENADRSSSFFSEPAMFVQFLLPLLAICILSSKHKNYRLAAIVALTLLLLQSGNALLGLMIIILYTFINYVKNIKGPSTIAYIIAATAILGIIGYFYVTSEMGQHLMGRSVTIQSNSVDELGYAGSGFLRIYRGYGVYEAYGTAQKVIGNDSEKYISSCISNSDVSKFFFRENDFYFNTIQSFLLFTGIIGVILFFLIIRSEWRQTDMAGRAILLTFVGLSFISSLYLTDTMALYLLLPQLLNITFKKNILITT